MLTSYWIACLMLRLGRLGLPPGEPFPTNPILTPSKPSALWTSGLSLGGLALLELAKASFCRVLRSINFSITYYGYWYPFTSRVCGLIITLLITVKWVL